MNPMLRFVLTVFMYATFVAGYGFAIAFMTAASAVVWGTGIAAALLVLCVLAFVGLSQRNSRLLDMRTPVKNAARRFGESGDYYACDVINADGTCVPALFTEDQAMVAIHRAHRNPEDVA